MANLLNGCNCCLLLNVNFDQDWQEVLGQEIEDVPDSEPQRTRVRNRNQFRERVIDEGDGWMRLARRMPHQFSGFAFSLFEPFASGIFDRTRPFQIEPFSIEWELLDHDDEVVISGEATYEIAAQSQSHLPSNVFSWDAAFSLQSDSLNTKLTNGNNTPDLRVTLQEHGYSISHVRENAEEVVGWNEDVPVFFDWNRPYRYTGDEHTWLWREWSEAPTDSLSLRWKVVFQEDVDVQVVVYRERFLRDEQVIDNPAKHWRRKCGANLPARLNRPTFASVPWEIQIETPDGDYAWPERRNLPYIGSVVSLSEIASEQQRREEIETFQSSLPSSFSIHDGSGTTRQDQIYPSLPESFWTNRTAVAQLRSTPRSTPLSFVNIYGGLTDFFEFFWPEPSERISWIGGGTTELPQWFDMLAQVFLMDDRVVDGSREILLRATVQCRYFTALPNTTVDLFPSQSQGNFGGAVFAGRVHEQDGWFFTQAPAVFNQRPRLPPLLSQDDAALFSGVTTLTIPNNTQIELVWEKWVPAWNGEPPEVTFDSEDLLPTSSFTDRITSVEHRVTGEVWLRSLGPDYLIQSDGQMEIIRNTAPVDPAEFSITIRPAPGLALHPTPVTDRVMYLPEAPAA